MFCCDWRDAPLLGMHIDAVIEDPPYGKRTHAGQRHGRRGKSSSTMLSEAGLRYDHLTPEDVTELVAGAHELCRGWNLAMTSHDLIPAYEAAAAACKRYCFAPLPIVTPGENVRLAGDGPSSWTVHLMVSRTNLKKCWSTKQGAYIVTAESHGGKGNKAVAGGKPLGLMEAIVADYTERGDIILDRYAGGGTTGVAAIRNGRMFVGCEREPRHFEIAVGLLQSTREQLSMFQEKM